MRYFWALFLYVTAIVGSVASCSAGSATGSSFGSSEAGGAGGLTASSSTGVGGATGEGGSTGVGLIFDSGPPPTDGAAGTCPAYKGDCAQQKLNCGNAGDGCGNILNCGTCTGNDTCGGSGTANVCGGVTCTPKTCADQGFNCGMATDTCGTVISCGATCPSGETCGAASANVCGTGTVCTPKTCAGQSYDCGSQSNGCGTILDCGTCPTGETCGGGSNPQVGVCGSVTCTPKTCADQGYNCGMATDTCGTVIDCGTCASGTCGASSPNVCGSALSCTGLCTQQTTCAGGGTTTITGKVFAPNGTDPLYNTLVYVPNSAVLPFVDGVAVPHCSCGSDVSGSPLVSTATATDGTFTLTNMPVGTNIPLVIQNGRWRRQFVIPSVPACTTTALPSTGTSQLRMPKTHLEGDIPLMGFVTGALDALECVLRKIGIADTEFSDPTGTGRVRFYQGDGDPGATYSGSTPVEDSLWASDASIEKYDMVYFACQGDEYDKTPAQQKVVIDYANNGGRVFTTHYSYVWLFDDAPFSGTANWAVDPNENNTFANDPQTGYVNTTFARGLAMAQWLQVVGASTTVGQIQINTLRDDFGGGVVPPSLLWLTVKDADLGTVPMHYTFDTPVGTAAASQCGRVLYSDFHVEDQEFFTQPTFPAECVTTGMTPQEKMLEFMIFDLGSCVAPPTCVPRTCTAADTTCGPVGDGCGGILQCGACPSGEACIGGSCTGGGCTPKTCAQQNFACGDQGDGCGNEIPCGACPSGESCTNGVCGSGGCTSKTCAQLGIACGSVGDGCGNIQNCGVCPSGEICGGGANPVAGQCGTPACTAKTCAQQGFNCGMASNGCNATISCGTCTGNQTCGGGGMANVCGGGAG